MAIATPTPTRTRRPAAATREHVLDVAQELFYWQGIHATGVDRVARAAEVGPTTLYRLFASKDDLVTAYVQRGADGYREYLEAATRDGEPRARILALFDAVLEQVQPETCRGCPFLMALAEYPDADSPVHQAAVAVKAWTRAYLRTLVDELGNDDPAALADQLALVLEGIYGSVQALTASGPTVQARAAVAALVDHAGRPQQAEGTLER
jgi:AcrR family transcriptional regulator